MVEMILFNEDDIEIDSDIACSDDDMLSIFTEWLSKYQFLNGDYIKFYDFEQHDDN